MWIEGNMIINGSKGKTKDYKKVMYFIYNNNIDDLKIIKYFYIKIKKN